jgi:hypothetical protein
VGQRGNILITRQKGLKMDGSGTYSAAVSYPVNTPCVYTGAVLLILLLMLFWVICNRAHLIHQSRDSKDYQRIFGKSARKPPSPCKIVPDFVWK